MRIVLTTAVFNIISITGANEKKKPKSGPLLVIT